MRPVKSPDPERASQQRRLLRIALPWVAVVGGLLLFVVQHRIDDRLVHATLGCEPPASTACLGKVAPSGMTLELAGSARDLACQMRSASSSPASAPSVQERVCIEARVQARWDDVTLLDDRLLVPLYVLLTLLVAAWITLNGRGGGHGRLAPVVLVLAVLLMAAADAHENRATQTMLILAEAAGAFGPGSTAPLDYAAHAARQASMLKWAVAAPWMLALAWNLWRWAGPGRVSRVLRMLGIAAALAAAGIGLLTVGAMLTMTDAVSMAGLALAISVGFGFGLLALLVVPIAVVIDRQGSDGKAQRPGPAG